MIPSRSIRLRHVVELNPSKSEARALRGDTRVAFLPMEAVSDLGKVDLSTLRQIDAIYNGYTYFRSGDVVIAKITPCFENGKGALIPEFEGGIGFGTTELHVLRASNQIDSRFLSYIVRSIPFRSLGTAEMTGAAGQQRVPEDFIKDFVIWLPPLSSQEAIADYLDEKTAAIDALIQMKRKLLDLLAEERAALINQAVTKGLDPGVPMKDSGVPWIGEIPAHWSAARLSFRYEQQLGKMLNPDATYGLDQAPYLANKDVQWGLASLNDLSTMSFSAVERAKFSLRTGDLLVCEGGETGRTAIWRDEIQPCYFQKAIHRLRPFSRERDNPVFLYYCMRAAANAGAFEESGNRSTIGHLTGEGLRAHRFPWPPASEQVGITDYLDQESSRVNRVTSVIDAQIDRLQEYRQALITAAVTGDLAIRAAA